MFNKILNAVQMICLCIITWVIYDTTQTIKREAAETKNKTIQELTALRKDTFAFLNKTVYVVDKRLDSIETGTFVRAEKVQDLISKKADDVNSNINAQLTQTNNSIKQVADAYSQVPKDLTAVVKRFDDYTNCEENDLCWQNMTSDLLIDSRNVIRDGSDTFRSVNKAVPKFVDSTQRVSDSIATNVPVITTNMAEITKNVNRITKPKWYDRIISYGVSGSMIYSYTIK